MQSDNNRVRPLGRETNTVRVHYPLASAATHRRASQQIVLQESRGAGERTLALLFRELQCALHQLIRMLAAYG
jgi:hypothetical protein